MRRIAVLGDGGWGTALAIHLRNRGCLVKLWGHDSRYVREMRGTRENRLYLPGMRIPPEVELVSDEKEAVDRVELVLQAIPCQYIRSTLSRFCSSYPRGVPVVSASKGIEKGSLMRCSEVIRDVLGKVRVVAISGPTHCEEVVRGLPTSMVAACSDRDLCERVQSVLHGANLRVYTNRDIVGVELGGALKNVLAIAAGICDGLGYGDNSKAAVITRGLSEIVRLGTAMGARHRTFLGLACVGDIYTTCASRFSRNRDVGERIGRGERLKDIRASMGQVAEGVDTTISVRALAKRHEVYMPICEEVYRVLFQGKSPARAVQDLMKLTPGDEAESPGRR